MYVLRKARGFDSERTRGPEVLLLLSLFHHLSTGKKTGAKQLSRLECAGAGLNTLFKAKYLESARVVLLLSFFPFLLFFLFPFFTRNDEYPKATRRYCKYPTLERGLESLLRTIVTARGS